MNEFTAIFLAVLAAGLALQAWLGGRQIAHVRAHEDAVPVPFAGDITPEAHHKAAHYTVAKTRLNLVGMGYGALLLLAWTVGGGLELMDSVWRGVVADPLLRGVGVMLSVLFVMGLLELPLAIYSTFVLEERFGFNRMTPGLFVADLVKSTALMLVFGIPLAWVVLWLMEVSGSIWWLYVWGVWMAFLLVKTWAYPRLIAPLFNKFTPLENERLRARIERVARAAGFTITDVFIMDGSRRSAHGNAYFTGLGRNKRIVFFDTLIRALRGDEIEAVLAHELGHYRLRHIQKFLAWNAVVTLAGLMLLGWLARQEWFYAGLGVTRPSDYAALILFMLVAPVFLVFVRPVMAHISRRFEYQADDFATDKSDAAALVRALVKLYRDNAATLTPDPVYSAFYHSHPPPIARIANLKARTA